MTGVAAALMLLAACSTPTSGVSTPAPTASSTSPADLEALRIKLGLPDCPVTDPEAAQIDDGLPQTALPCLGSDKVVNLAGLPRTPTIINFWAQWCAPCRAESPFLRGALSKLDGVSFIGVNYNDPLPDWALEFASVAGWDYPHVMDQDKQLRAPMQVPGIPTTYFVAADGTIAGVHAGELASEQQLLDLAEQYLGSN